MKKLKGKKEIIKEIIKEIDKYNNKNSVTIMVIDKDSDRKSVYKGYNVPLSKVVQKSIAKIYYDNIRELMAEKQIEKYDFVNRGKGNIQEINKKLIEKISDMDSIINEDMDKDNTFNKDTNIDRINCVILRYYYLDDKGKHELTIYSRYRQLNKKFKKGFKLTFEGKQMKELEEEIIYFDGDIEMFVIDDKCYIVNEGILYSIFDFDLDIKDIIKTKKKDIIDDDFIDKPEEFISFCESDKSYSKRLCNVLVSYDRKYMKSNKDNLKDFLTEFKIDLKINKKNQLMIDNKVDANNIIKILSRIFVYDGLSKEKMESKGVEKIIS